MPSNHVKEYGPYPAPGYVTMQAYADSVGLSRIAIQKRVVAGKLEGCWFKDELNRYHMDAALCDEALKFKSTREMGAKKSDSGGDELDPGIQATNAYNRAKSANEVIKLQKAQIELEELKGSLVSMNEVKKEQYLIAKILRDQLMAFPDRIAALLTSMTDERKIHTLLSNEIRNCLKVVDEKAREALDK